MKVETAMTNEYIRGFVILAALIAGNFAFQASYDNPNWAVATERSFFEFWAIFVFLLTSRPISKKDFRNFDEKELVEIQKLSKLIVETIDCIFECKNHDNYSDRHYKIHLDQMTKELKDKL